MSTRCQLISLPPSLREPFSTRLPLGFYTNASGVFSSCQETCLARRLPPTQCGLHSDFDAEVDSPDSFLTFFLGKEQNMVYLPMLV